MNIKVEFLEGRENFASFSLWPCDIVTQLNVKDAVSKAAILLWLPFESSQKAAIINAIFIRVMWKVTCHTEYAKARLLGTTLGIFQFALLSLRP